MKTTEISADVTPERAVTEEEKRRQAELKRAAGIRVGDQIAREHPHPLDDIDPKRAGRELANDPIIRAETAELIDIVFGDQLPRRLP